MFLKKVILSIGCFVTALNICSQTPNFQWAKQMSGSSVGEGHSVAVDASGNVYTTGRFQGTVDFDPGAGTYTLSPASTNSNIFISKLDASGNFLWAIQIGNPSTTFSNGNAITIDAFGDIYITGSFQGTADFDPGTGIFNLTAMASDHFVLKLNVVGNFIWAKQVVSSPPGSQGLSIACDGFGNVYTIGGFKSTADFDPGAATFNLTSIGAGVDIFILKLDVSGNFIWAKSMGAPLDDYGNSITVDLLGNVYASGYFFGTGDFDPSSSNFNLISAGGQDIFILKLDPSGNFVWAKNIGSTGDDNAYGITTDALNDLYITGGFQATVDFDTGVGTFNLTSNGGFDMYVLKLDASGNFVLVRKLGGASGDFATSIIVDSSSNIYTTGYFIGVSDFDPGAGIFNLSSLGGVDIFISKLDAVGNFIWAQQLGGTLGDYGTSIKVDAADNVYTTGYFYGTSDFDPSSGIFNLTASSNINIFVHKMNQTPVGIRSNSNIAGLNIYPNPTNGAFTIDLDGLHQNTFIEVYSALGILVKKQLLSSENNIIDLKNEANGLYFIYVLEGKKAIKVSKIVKE